MRERMMRLDDNNNMICVGVVMLRRGVIVLAGNEPTKRGRKLKQRDVLSTTKIIDVDC